MRFLNADEALFHKRWGWIVQLRFNYEQVKVNGKRTEKWADTETTELIKFMDAMMKSRSDGHFERRGNNFYFERLKDVYDFRLMFDEHIKSIKQSTEALTRKWRV